jgi:hypothetical protein
MLLWIQYRFPIELILMIISNNLFVPYCNLQFLYPPTTLLWGGILGSPCPTKNERDPPLFTSKLLIKFQNILRNTTQVIIRHTCRVKTLFSVISSPITLERQKWKSSKMKGILPSWGGSLSFLVRTISNVLVMEIVGQMWGAGVYLSELCSQ